MHHQHLEAGAAAGRRARMQEDPAIVMGLLPASSNRMGSHITHNCCAQHSCSEKLYSLRTGRHGGEREKRPSPPSHKCVQIARKAKLPRGLCINQYMLSDIYMVGSSALYQYENGTSPHTYR